MNNDLSIKIRNLKNGDWYWVGRKILRLYGAGLGTSGIAVYSALACFADADTQACFPGLKVIAAMLSISPRTVSRKIGMLKKIGLVAAERHRNYYRYVLLEPPEQRTNETRGVDKRDTYEWTPRHPNNNQLTIDIYKKIDTETASAFKGLRPAGREAALAMDIAEALDDHKALPFYLACARRHPEPLLRRTLAEVKRIPINKIKKGRAALFNYLIRKHAREAA